MIKKLRLKFILIIMAILTFIFILIFGALNIFMHNIFETDSRILMEQISKNEGLALKNIDSQKGHSTLAPPKSFNMKNVGRHFAIKLNHENDILNIVWELPYKLSDEEINELLNDIIHSNNTKGTISTWRYLITDKPYGKLIVFLDNRVEENTLLNLRWISLGIGGTSLFILFFVSLFLSKWATRPVEIAFKKQHRFVSDASHELRTPITIINANADVLESEIGKNKWLNFIKSESNRMNELVTNLLYLTRYDNKKDINEFQNFNLSSSILSTILPFESVAFEAQKTLSYDIPNDIFVTGDESKIRQLIVILLDNAIKNSFVNGKINVTLKVNGNKKILSVYNTGPGIDKSEKDKIFERFYRSDTSRARETGGYGLGLAIAKNIVTEHSGKITVKSEKDKFAEFIVTL